MTKVTIISGFLGAGKTTFIKKLIEEIYKGQKVVLIENEFGEIGIDGGFLKDAGVQINEMNSGCICCSLVGDFGKALKQVSHDYAPDMIIIEPSGVGKLSDVIAAVENVKEEADLELENFITVADATKCKLYMKNFGEFYNNQLESATTVVLSRTQNVDEAKLETAVNLIKEHNDKASIITTPWDELTGEQIMSALKHTSLVDDMLKDMDICPECGHHHEHGHHHAYDVFTSMGIETAHKFTEDELSAIIDQLAKDKKFGEVLRAKGIVPAAEGEWFHFDLVPEETEVRRGAADFTGRVCVIGSNLEEDKIKELFKVS